MKIVIKAFLPNSKSLCFHAEATSRKNFVIYNDLNNIYLSLFRNALVGNFSFEYIDQETYNIDTYEIKGHNFRSNISSFSDFLERIYGLDVEYKVSQKAIEKDELRVRRVKKREISERKRRKGPALLSKKRLVEPKQHTQESGSAHPLVSDRENSVELADHVI